MKGNVQKVQIVKGKEEKVANILCLVVSIGIMYYSFHPAKAEQHLEYLNRKTEKIRARIDKWRGMNDTLHAIWELDETPEPPTEA